MSKQIKLMLGGHWEIKETDDMEATIACNKRQPYVTNGAVGGASGNDGSFHYATSMDIAVGDNKLTILVKTTRSYLNNINTSAFNGSSGCAELEAPVPREAVTRSSTTINNHYISSTSNLGISRTSTKTFT